MKQCKGPAGAAHPGREVRREAATSPAFLQHAGWGIYNSLLHPAPLPSPTPCSESTCSPAHCRSYPARCRLGNCTAHRVHTPARAARCDWQRRPRRRTSGSCRRRCRHCRHCPGSTPQKRRGLPGPRAAGTPFLRRQGWEVWSGCGRSEERDPSSTAGTLFLRQQRESASRGGRCGVGCVCSEECDPSRTAGVPVPAQRGARSR